MFQLYQSYSKSTKLAWHTHTRNTQTVTLLHASRFTFHVSRITHHISRFTPVKHSALAVVKKDRGKENASLRG